MWVECRQSSLSGGLNGGGLSGSLLGFGHDRLVGSLSVGVPLGDSGVDGGLGSSLSSANNDDEVSVLVVVDVVELKGSTLVGRIEGVINYSIEFLSNDVHDIISVDVSDGGGPWSRSVNVGLKDFFVFIKSVHDNGIKIFINSNGKVSTFSLINEVDNVVFNYLSIGFWGDGNNTSDQVSHIVMGSINRVRVGSSSISRESSDDFVSFIICPVVYNRPVGSVLSSVSSGGNSEFVGGLAVVVVSTSAVNIILSIIEGPVVCILGSRDVFSIGVLFIPVIGSANDRP